MKRSKDMVLAVTFNIVDLLVLFFLGLWLMDGPAGPFLDVTKNRVFHYCCWSCFILAGFNAGCLLRYVLRRGRDEKP